MKRFLLVVIVLLLASVSSQQTSDDDDNEGSFRNDKQCITRYRLLPINETHIRETMKVPWAYHGLELSSPWDYFPPRKCNKRSGCREHQWAHYDYERKPEAWYGLNWSVYRVFLMMEESYKRVPMFNPWTGEEMPPQVFGPQVLELAGGHSKIANARQRGFKLLPKRFIQHYDAAMKLSVLRPSSAWDYFRFIRTRPYGTYYYPSHETYNLCSDDLYAWKHSYNYALSRE